jgi:hypothetical protein
VSSILNSHNKITMHHPMAWSSMRHPKIHGRFLLVSVFLLLQGTSTIAVSENRKPAETTYLTAAAGANAVTELDALTAKAQADGQVPVILRLNVDFQAEGRRSYSGVIAQRNAIATASSTVVQSLAGKDANNIKVYKYVPYLAVTVNPSALQALAKNPMVIEISEDVPAPQLWPKVPA